MEVPFTGRIDTKLHLGQNSPKTPNFATGMSNFQSNQYTNFYGYGKRRKIPTDRLYEIGVRESNGDVISAVGRHLMVETTSGSVWLV
jgi:hypothetical protein